MVLAKLPRALKGDAREWFGSLPPNTRARMNSSLAEWARQVRSRFQKSRMVALEEADALEHSFDTEDSLTVRQYLSRKQGLYLEAGEHDEDLIICRLLKGLDPTLAGWVHVYEGMSLGAFHQAVTSAEIDARIQHLNIKAMHRHAPGGHFWYSTSRVNPR